MKTTIYLVRHSIRLRKDDIEEYNTTQSNLIKNEKIILSVEGEKRAEILSNEKELQNIDAVYTSNCVRTLQTAKYLLEKQHLKATIDERLDERRVGKPNDDVVKDWFLRQYLDESYKTEGGESQVDVRKRVTEVINEILEKHKGKRIAVFSHGYAITFYLMTWCKFSYNNETDNMILTFNGKELMNKKINAPDVFKIEFDGNNNPLSITNIEFEDLPFKDGLGRDKNDGPCTIVIEK